MAHLSSSFTSYEAFLDQADAVFATDLTALNNSGVSGQALVSVIDNGDGTGYVNVAVTAAGTTPNQSHVQHIHGLFDAEGNPVDSQTPTLANDTDRDGLVEVLEGVPSYGDVLLPLDTDGVSPISDGNGDLAFIQSYAIEDMSNFVSPVTGTQYSYEDIAQFALREYVIHGVDVPDGIGEGTGGEVDGGVNGYTPILPAASGELSEVTADEAEAILAAQRDDASSDINFGGGDNTYFAGLGDDTVRAGGGDDSIFGEGDDDMLFGERGNDRLDGGQGADLLGGGAGDDLIAGQAGQDTIYGAQGDDDLRGGRNIDLVLGGAGDDRILGQAGDDLLAGGTGDDTVSGNRGDDLINGGAGDDMLDGGNGDDDIAAGAGDDMVLGGGGSDVIRGGAGSDSLNGGDGVDVMRGQKGDDLLVGSDGDDRLFGQAGDDIFGGLAGDDLLAGGAGSDEFHFDAGTGTDTIADFTQGEDVISLLNNGGAITFENSTETAGRGDSDLSALDFDTILSYDNLDLNNDQQVVYSAGGTADLEAGIAGAEVEAYIAASDGTNTTLYYDDDWSTLEGREAIATLNNVSTALTAADFDVY